MARTSKYQAVNTVLPDAQISWRAGLYVRLSKEDGDKIESESVSSQREILGRYLESHPEICAHDFYIDDGWSGTDFDRPSFQRMLSDITAKKINCVVVKDLSRFGRNYVEAGKYLETVFPLFGVRFISVNDQIDSTANPLSINNVIVPFKNIMNDEYCRDISMKVRSALDARRRQGRFIGSFAAYGYKKDPHNRGRLIIDEEAAHCVQRIYGLFLEGYSVLSIARTLNKEGVPNPSAYKAQRGLNCARTGGLWVDSTVRRILTNELYIGNLVQKKKELVSYKIHLAKAVERKRRIIVEGTHEPIIAKEDFEKVQALLQRDTRTSPHLSKLSKFSGFLKCADCGRAMLKRTVKQPYKTYDYYCCSTYRKMHSGACSKHAIRLEAIEEGVLTALNEYIRLAVDFERIAERADKAQKRSGILKQLEGELAGRGRELEKAQRLLLDLYPDYKSGILSREQYFALKEKYENAEQRAKGRMEQIKEEMKRVEQGVDKTNEFIASFVKYRGFQELTREILSELVENIYIHEGGAIEIRLKCREAFLSAQEYFTQQQTDTQSVTA